MDVYHRTKTWAMMSSAYQRPEIDKFKHIQEELDLHNTVITLGYGTLCGKKAYILVSVSLH
jgi:hypothetical protein